MFYEFSHRHTPCTVDGVADKVILSRDTKSTSIIGREYMFAGRFSPDSLVHTGSLVATTDSYLVEALRITPDTDKYCSLIKVNYPSLQFLHNVVSYDSNLNPIGSTWPAVATFPAYVEYVHGNLSYRHGLLLASTVFSITIQSSTALDKTYRVMIDGKPYKVDDINLSVISGLQVIQVSVDTRS